MGQNRKSDVNEENRLGWTVGQRAFIPLDEIDEQLLSMLERDGRTSYSDLAATVGLTPGGARARVKRLQEHHVVKIIGVTNPYAVGMQSVASLQIEVSGDIDGVADRLSEYDGVRYVVLGSGRFSIMLEVYAETPQALFTLINRELREVPGVTRIETFVYDTVHTHRPIFPLTGATGPL